MYTYTEQKLILYLCATIFHEKIWFLCVNCFYFNNLSIKKVKFDEKKKARHEIMNPSFLLWKNFLSIVVVTPYRTCTTFPSLRANNNLLKENLGKTKKLGTSFKHYLLIMKKL